MGPHRRATVEAAMRRTRLVRPMVYRPFVASALHRCGGQIDRRTVVKTDVLASSI